MRFTWMMIGCLSNALVANANSVAVGTAIGMRVFHDSLSRVARRSRGEHRRRKTCDEHQNE